jgi:transposase
MVLVDGAGVPLGVHLSAANLAERQLAEATLAEVAKPQRQKIRRIIVDRGYDSRALHDRMAEQGIELLAPKAGFYRRLVSSVGIPCDFC